MKNKTPEEAWSGFKPLVAYFRVFGCVSHVHIPDCKRTKLDDKSVRCLFLGVSEESKAYRLYDPISQKIIISRDVVFEKDNNWDWDKSHKETILVDLNWGDNEKESNAADGNGDEAEIDEHSNIERAVNGSNEENLSSSSEDLSFESHEHRIRKQPTWMRDYESGEGLSEEEETTNLVMFIANDPILFEEGQKDVKW